MTVRELIAELQKMPQDAEVTMWVEPGRHAADVYWVERRPIVDNVFLCDKYYTPYAEDEE